MFPRVPRPPDSSCGWAAKDFPPRFVRCGKDQENHGGKNERREQCEFYGKCAAQPELREQHRSEKTGDDKNIQDVQVTADRKNPHNSRAHRPAPADCSTLHSPKSQQQFSRPRLLKVLPKIQGQPAKPAAGKIRHAIAGTSKNSQVRLRTRAEANSIKVCARKGRSPSP
jgi:hypothetical protein